MNRANRPRFSRISGSSYASKLLGRAGDGSTLTLDFTTGVLDPRLTFTRTGNATFINSSGLVQWADSNLAVNSAFGGTSPGTGWTTNGSGSMSSNAGTFTAQVTSAATAFLSRIIAVNNGLRYSASVNVTTITGTINYNEVLTIGGTISSTKFYRNGVEVGPSGNGVAQAQTGLITVIWTCGGTNYIRFGIGASGTNHTNVTVVLDSPRVVPGEFTQATYFASTTTAEYQAPRFDYDPTTGSPRGLLIEGTVNNLFNWSETFDTTGGTFNWNWSTLNVTRGTVTTTNPTGASATVIKIEETTTNGLHAPLSTPTVLASTTYTFSVWAKAAERSFVLLLENGGSGANSMVNLSTGAIVSESSAASTTVTPLGTTGWYRISMRFTTIVGQTTANCQLRLSTNGTTTSYAGTTGSGIYIWGAQLEQGSGASSYIPTGASTGTRNADNCYIYDTTSSGGLSWFKTATQGTFYVEMFKRTAGTAFAGAGFGTRATAFQEFMLYQAVGNNWLSFNWGAGEYTTNYSALSSPFLIKAAVALSPSTPTTEADSTVSINGSNSALNTGPNIALPFTSDLFCIGGRGPAGGTAPSQNYAETAIRRIKFFPFAMTAAQMNALTTL